MYDNIIKIYNLESIKNKIESITTVKLNDQLTLHLRLKKQIMTCPVCQTTPMYFHGYRLKQIIHSVSIEHKVLIAYQSRRYKCKLCCKVISESNPFNQSYERISLNTKLSILNHLKDIHHNFADTAKLFNVSSQSVINIFDKHIDAHHKQLAFECLKQMEDHVHLLCYRIDNIWNLINMHFLLSFSKASRCL